MPDNAQHQYTQASLATADKLKTQAHTLYQKNLTRLSLQEVDEAVNIVSKMVPAGNVPGVILNGLARLTGRRPPPQTIERDVNLLFKGVEQVLDKAAFGAFFAGPAAVIWGYQHLLKLAGKTPDDAFPNGTWQFYVDYALREDTARHANETHGFDTLLTMHDLQLSPTDRTVAWVLTAMQIIQQYDDLLANEWRERVHTHIADEVSDGRLTRVYSQWARQRPYGRRDDAGRMTYPAYRRHKFDAYMQEEVLPQLSRDERTHWQQRIDELEASALPAYQAQMSIHSYLEPQSYHEEHIAIPVDELSIGVIHGGRYYLVPLQRANGERNDVHGVRSQVAAIFNGDVAPVDAPDLTRLASIQRTALPKLHKQLSDNARHAWQQLRHAPILVNADQRPAELPLAALRQTERGIGDHALTIFDTGESIVFDQSHIYFDGAWGAALAEIMTNEALSWARYLASLEAPRANLSGVMALNFDWQPTDETAIAAAPTIVTEASAESSKANIDAMLGLRKLFKQRSDLLKLTVNDLLVLYRAIHAVSYQPSSVVKQAVTALLDDDATRAAGQAVQAAWKVKRNPAILIPIDASQTHPAERLYPMSFDVPIYDLDLIALHERTRQAQRDYQAGKRDTGEKPFNTLQHEYLEVLAGFGDVMSRAKEIALAGEGTSSGSIRLMAHMPRPIQQLMNEIPSRIDVLNDIIKGREVFSNVGAVAPTSTLTRFITAKDDNEQKTLAWGVMTDAQRTMIITLRDFRPHVRQLQAIGKPSLAQRITQDYLDSYVRGLNEYIAELRDITYTSRQTRLQSGTDDAQ